MWGAIGLILASGAALGAVTVTPVEAAVTHGPGAAAQVDAVSRTQSADGAAVAAGDPTTTVTFTVTSGALTMTVPANSNLGSGAPGTLISAPIGACAVTDARALASASWTVTAAETDFINGTQTIPATSATYSPAPVTTTGNITVTPLPITLTNAAQTVLTATAGVGDNSASWDPTVAVNVPAAAVAGSYSGTLTQSVS